MTCFVSFGCHIFCLFDRKIFVEISHKEKSFVLCVYEQIHRNGDNPPSSREKTRKMNKIK